MNYTEVTGDLFTAGTDCLLAHCISSDFALGAGIAKTFRDRYGVRDKLIATGGKDRWNGKGCCIITGSSEDDKPMWNVANLITKAKCYEKPTYKTLEQALIEMKQQCAVWGYRRIAMPLIGCGLDGLSWDRVSAIIKDVFADYDGEIVVYRFK